MLTVNIPQSVESIIDCFKANLVPILVGSPGIGKSDIVRQIASEYRLKVIDLRLSQCDPTDLMGFPKVDPATGKAGYAPMDTFPLATDTPPKGYEGWLLFLDEFNSAPRSVQAAAYKLTLDRAVGQCDLHKNCYIVCAGNKATDGAIVNDLSTAMQSRLVHLELAVDHAAWLTWAADAGIDYRIRAYINFKPDLLHRFSPDHNDKTFPCPRTWEFASRLIKGWGDIAPAKLPLLAGTISEGAAREFIGFCKIFQDLPTIQQIMNNPMGIPVPKEPSTLYAISGSIGNHLTKDNVSTLLQFVERMPIEFQVIALKDTIRRERAMKDNPDIRKWTAKNAQELF